MKNSYFNDGYLSLDYQDSCREVRHVSNKFII